MCDKNHKGEVEWARAVHALQVTLVHYASTAVYAMFHVMLKLAA